MNPAAKLQKNHQIATIFMQIMTRRKRKKTKLAGFYLGKKLK